MQGLADYLWLDKSGGAVTAWRKEGRPVNPTTNGGSAIFWQAREIVAEGGDLRGECINKVSFGDIEAEGHLTT